MGCSLAVFSYENAICRVRTPRGVTGNERVVHIIILWTGILVSNRILQHGNKQINKSPTSLLNIGLTRTRQVIAITIRCDDTAVTGKLELKRLRAKMCKYIIICLGIPAYYTPISMRISPRRGV